MSGTEQRLRAVLLLAGLASLTAAGLSWLQTETAERVRDNEARLLLARLQDVLPAAEQYDNQPVLDVLMLRDPRLGSERSLPVYRARRGELPVALVLTVIAQGYVDDIELLVGIDAAGKLIGVRAVRHSETPGLGDGIDARRSDWIAQFSGRSLDDRWALRRDGGDIDQLTGATITSRAVLKAIHAALEVFATRRDELLAPPADPDTMP